MMPSIITQEIHIIKRIFGENVIDSMISTIKNAIKSAPDCIRDIEIPSALKLFEDAMYDDSDIKRMVEFKQYGSLYICKVIDVTSSKPYNWLAYSLFDILETYNNGNRKNTDHVQYIKLFESDKDCTFNVSTVETPKNYNTNTCIYDDEKALNEIGKYKILFKDSENHETTVDVICNPHLLQVSNPYVNIDSENLFDVPFIYGQYNLIVDGISHPVKYDSFILNELGDGEPVKLIDWIKTTSIYAEKAQHNEDVHSIICNGEEISPDTIISESKVTDITLVFEKKITISVLQKYHDIIEERSLNYFSGEKTFEDLKNDISTRIEFPDDGIEHHVEYTVTDANGEDKFYMDNELLEEDINVSVIITEVE